MTNIEKPLVQVFIATYNRPSLVLNAIHSALNQNFDSFAVIVSDNSTNDETESLVLKIKDNRLSYKRRNPSLPVIDHLNAILQDVTSDYFMIFHDDDVMHFNMLEQQIKCFEKYGNEIIAIGTNAKKIIKNKSKKNFFSKNKEEIVINGANEFILLYFEKKFPPFSSYLYRKMIAKQLLFDPQKGGKYCDVAFLIDVSNLGRIIILNESLMDYHIHSKQDTVNSQFDERMRLFSYISKTTIYKRDCKFMKIQRIMNLYAEFYKMIKNKNFTYSPKRKWKFYMLFLTISPFEYFPKMFLRHTVSKFHLIKK